MKRCFNCIYYFTRDICAFCCANNNIKEIKHPFFMGGNKCECYEKCSKQKNNFEYPKEDKELKKC